MTYVLPQVLVFQDLQRQPSVAANPLCSHISGGHAHLVRFDQADEKALGSLGYYDETQDNAYAWPGRPAGAVVDSSYTKLYIEDALLRYFADNVSTGATINRVAGYFNRIYSSTLAFATANGTDRSAVLKDRDVRIGDVVKVTGSPNGGALKTLWTYVQGFAADKVAGAVKTATTVAGNATTESADLAVVQSSGVENCVTAAATGTYSGLASGYLTETYTVEVIQGSVGGDFSTARVRVTSGSGTDNQASVTPAASDPFAIGTRGVMLEFTADSGSCSVSASLADVEPNDLIVGQTFEITVAQAFTATTVASGGSYSSSSDTTYIIEVTKGGAFGSSPEITVTTSNGIDQSGPHVVSGLASAIAIGSFGVTITFAGSTQGLRKGDRFTIPATGASEGAVRTLILGHNLDSAFLANDDLSLELFIKKPTLEISSNRIGFAPNKNWEQSATEMTVKAGVVAYDSTWTDGGEQVALPVISAEDAGYGEMFVEYRAWMPTHVGVVESIIDSSELSNVSGPLTPDNPLKWGLHMALQNNNGTPVLFTAVSDPNDVDAWPSVLEALETRDDTYNLVPLTDDYTVQSLFVAHINSQSSPTEGRWRAGWFSLPDIPSIPLVSAGSSVRNHTAATTTDGEEALATIEDDPNTSGTQYTLLRLTSGNANFIAAGVRAGDVVRTLYTTDGFGGTSYTTFVIDAVLSENDLRLASGPGAAVPVASKFEVWRNLTRPERAAENSVAASAFGNRRIRAVWTGGAYAGSEFIHDMYVASAVAALASAVLPHQDLTNVSLSGVSSVMGVSTYSKQDLNTMAGGGVWIIAQSPAGLVYTRDAVTSADYDDFNQRREMITRNVDSVSFRFRDYLEPFIGVTNVTPSMRDIILTGMQRLIRTLKTERSTPQLGAQLIEADIAYFETSTLFRDRYVCQVNLQVPVAIGNIEQRLVV